jgi:hypothetical protein
MFEHSTNFEGERITVWVYIPETFSYEDDSEEKRYDDVVTDKQSHIDAIKSGRIKLYQWATDDLKIKFTPEQEMALLLQCLDEAWPIKWEWDT